MHDSATVGQCLHESGCPCGRVRYRIHCNPSRTLVCHCRFCQRMTGSTSCAEALFPTDAVEFCGATASQYDHVSRGSGKVPRPLLLQLRNHRRADLRALAGIPGDFARLARGSKTGLGWLAHPDGRGADGSNTAGEHRLLPRGPGDAGWAGPHPTAVRRFQSLPARHPRTELNGIRCGPGGVRG